MKDVTAITVTCNTPDVFKRMYDAFRSCYPQMPLMIVENSDKDSEARKVMNDYSDDLATVYLFDKNIGHGRGLDFAIRNTKTKYVLIMDTDTIIYKDPLPAMMALMDDDTYGVGCVTEIGKDGYDFRAFKHHKIPIKYLHPFFALISVEQYKNYKPFVHHGAPWYKVAVELHMAEKSDKIKHFNGLKAFDHAANGALIAAETEYVRHDFGSTRRKLKSMGRDEIPDAWIS